MRKIFLFFSILLMSVVARGQSISPTVTSTSGGFYAHSSATISWTMGEVAVQPYATGNASISQGFQNPHIEVAEPTFISNEISFSLIVYPIPAKDYLMIETEDYTDPLNVRVYNIQGALMLEKVLISSTGQIDLSRLPSATYILKISDQANKVLTVQKLIKH